MKLNPTLPLGGLLTGILLFTSTSCNKFEQPTCRPGNNKVTVFATGLNNPRGLKFGPDGYLYVAEGGTGGTNSTVGQCTQVVPPVGPYKGSETSGRISKISKSGVRTTITDKLPSTQNTELVGGDISGVGDVAFIGNTLYALITGAGCSHGVTSMPNGLRKINADGSSTQVADLSAYTMANPVKNPEEDDFEPDGDWYSMINLRGDFYAIEANHGELVRITPDGKVSRVIDISASQGHIVPTSVTYWDGNFYVGNLNPFPIVDGGSSIYKISPSGDIQKWATGFSTILGVVFDSEGDLYVLETAVGTPFPAPGKGQIVRLNASGSRETIATGLSMPTGITLGPDGQLYVSNVGFGPLAVGGGQILQIDVRACTNNGSPYTSMHP
ncbi:ScyD/ScyE family protein [Hymenobacter sp. BT491]|uniref:ScyD/ScyE family protein n=1 Tax=Hymenobacter sp. BT491 TaxID=2766779 RepID=UPI001653EB2D|nr:ScyD/ScyE family protein [Hymenobacter sp. BT491]MBC6990242.1 ScyD/ScyE family protein [Hymenobacter sp. BT491]